MKKLLLLVVCAATSLIGCNLSDSTTELYDYDQYAYVVNVSPTTKPAGLVAFEITYLDANGQIQSKTITESWYHIVPARKGFKMKLTSKLILAPGATRPTSGTVNYVIDEGISGVKDQKPVSSRYAANYSEKIGVSYSIFNKMLDEAAVRTCEYEIKPIKL